MPKIFFSNSGDFIQKAGDLMKKNPPQTFFSHATVTKHFCFVFAFNQEVIIELYPQLRIVSTCILLMIVPGPVYCKLYTPNFYLF